VLQNNHPTRVSITFFIFFDGGSGNSVPVHGNQDLKTGLLRHFIKVAEIDENEL
jgi:hypothetical protein